MMSSATDRLRNENNSMLTNQDGELDYPLSRFFHSLLYSRSRVCHLGSRERSPAPAGDPLVFFSLLVCLCPVTLPPAWGISPPEKFPWALSWQCATHLRSGDFGEYESVVESGSMLYEALGFSARYNLSSGTHALRCRRKTCCLKRWFPSCARRSARVIRASGVRALVDLRAVWAFILPAALPALNKFPAGFICCCWILVGLEVGMKI